MCVGVCPDAVSVDKHGDMGEIVEGYSQGKLQEAVGVEGELDRENSQTSEYCVYVCGKTRDLMGKWVEGARGLEVVRVTVDLAVQCQPIATTK